MLLHNGIQSMLDVTRCVSRATSHILFSARTCLADANSIDVPPNEHTTLASAAEKDVYLLQDRYYPSLCGQPDPHCIQQHAQRSNLLITFPRTYVLGCAHKSCHARECPVGAPLCSYELPVHVYVIWVHCYDWNLICEKAPFGRQLDTLILAGGFGAPFSGQFRRSLPWHCNSCDVSLRGWWNLPVAWANPYDRSP